MAAIVVICKYTIGQKKLSLFFLTADIKKQKISLKIGVGIMKNQAILIADNDEVYLPGREE